MLVQIPRKSILTDCRCHTQALTMTVRAEIREGDRYADMARLQRGIHTHMHSTQSTPLTCGDSEQPTRGPVLSPSIQRTSERSTALKSQLSGLAWPTDTSAEQERRWQPRWGRRADLHGARAMDHEGRLAQHESCSLSESLATGIQSRVQTNIGGYCGDHKRNFRE